MKNLILFMMLVVVAISCTSDDNVATTPFEGRWVVLTCFFDGTPPPPEPSKTPKEALIETNALDSYILFRGNEYFKESSGEIYERGTFTYIHNSTSETNSYYTLILVSNNGEEDVSYVNFSSNDFFHDYQNGLNCFLQRIK